MTELEKPGALRWLGHVMGMNENDKSRVEGGSVIFFTVSEAAT